MKRLLVVLPLLLASACGSAPKPKPVEKPPAFAIDDCAIVGAIERDHYKASSAAPLATRLNGEGVDWKPTCDWQSLGVKLVDQAAAPTQVTINRPRYDKDGVLIRTSIQRGEGHENALCRLHRVEEQWKVLSCGADPKDTLPPPPPPSPADATPDKGLAKPLVDAPTSRNPQPNQADPGAPGPGQN